MPHLSDHKPNFLSRGRLDRVGFIFSMACAVHCATLPLWIAAATFVGLGWIADERTELLIVALTLGLGATRIFYSFFREHGRWQCVALFAAGAVSVLFSFHSAPTGMALGGVLIAAAHAANQRFCSRHNH